MVITELDKPQGTWCPHCAIGKGCGIYLERPGECRAFHCGYLTEAKLGEHWRPVHCKMVLTADPAINLIAIQVDPGSPTAWQKQPHYDEIKSWARTAAKTMGRVVVMIKRRTIVILPDRDVDLGDVGANERIVTRRTGPGGTKLDVFKVRADDPLLSGKEAGVVYDPGRAVN
ncbi:MAG: hypothetical protein ABIP15_06700 [Devosia sp.]